MMVRRFWRWLSDFSPGRRMAQADVWLEQAVRERLKELPHDPK